MEPATVRHRFNLGQMLITANALAKLNKEDVAIGLTRHSRCDWGECDAHDAAENALALRQGLRLLSAYRDRNNIRFWIITEADRTTTTVLLPEDY